MKDITKILSLKRPFYLTGALALIIFLFLIGSWISKGTFGLEENLPKLEFLCDKTSATSGDTLTCLISGSAGTYDLTEIKTEYNLPQSISYQSFNLDSTCQDNCFKRIVSTNEDIGFSIDSRVVTSEQTSVYPVSNNFTVGIISLKISDTVSANQEITFGLKNIIFIDDDNNEHSISDITATIRIKNDDASLKDLSIENISLNESFSSSQLAYTATVSNEVSQIKVLATPNDQFAFASGDGELDLHYGTNYFNILVTSEDGKQTKTYKLNVYREYEFTTTKYIYNKEENYLYTRNDYEPEVIKANLEKLSNNLTYNIKYNKLSIKYVNEELKNINIVNFQINNHLIDGKIYLNSGLTYSQLLGKIVLNNVNITVTDQNNQVITSGQIKEGYKLNVYYSINQDQLLESYDVVLEYLSFSDKLVIDSTNKIIKKITPNTTYGDIMKLIETNGNMTLIKSDGSQANSSEIVKTGDTIKINTGTEETTYTISVLGDLNGDGQITINDVAKLYGYIKNKFTLDETTLSAGELTDDGSINVNDVAKLYGYVKGKVTTLEVE